MLNDKTLTLEKILTEKHEPYSIGAYLQNAVQMSPFLLNLLQKNAYLQEDLLLNTHQPYQLAAMKSWLDAQNIFDENTLKQGLRRLRQLVLARIMVRDLNGLCDLTEVMYTTSVLAEVTIQTAIAHISNWISVRYGVPSVSELMPTKTQSLIVIGMGKLGGYELNVSSDVDLIFAYESPGETNGNEVISNQEYFTLVAKKLMSAIDEVTSDGFVFRVDMRLRPFGSEGALVCSLEALENYYQSYGREWERYAWIKGRVIAGGDDHFIRELKPFVYRKYLDYGAIDSMRDLKRQIQLDVLKRDLHDNIKLGRGGIREIEFIAQVYQLMRGGHDPSLQVKSTLKALQNLAQKGIVDATIVDQLTISYVFLRNLEHRLQYFNDAQTHALPVADQHRDLIAKSMHFDSWQACSAVINQHRQFVAKQFDAIFSTDEEAKSHTSNQVDFWNHTLDTKEVLNQLSRLGYDRPIEALQMLDTFKKSNRVKHLPELSRSRLDSVMPIVIELSATHANAQDTLRRMITLIETVCRRASYLAFFAEFRDVLHRLVKLVSASPWLANYLCQHPVLLDSLMESPNEDVIDQHQLELDLLEKLKWLDGDTEQQMNVLREFQQMQLFALASKDVIKRIPIRMLSGLLSELADMILRVTLKTVWSTIKGRHCEEPKFAIIAYGKHGGRELGFSSDLDLIFLYEDDHPEARDIYSRLGMRLIAWLNTMTSSGILYEIDMQLRPDGGSGLLVVSTKSFAHYQLEKAWVWEHQAITRARFAVGHEVVGQAFEQIRLSVLTMPRDVNTIKQAILEMRHRMKSTYRFVEGQFDLKKSLGGMIDVEFIVQFLVLIHAKAYPKLCENVGNIEILKLCGKFGLVPEELARRVAASYIELRRRQHRLRLQGETDPTVPDSSVSVIVEAVRELWNIVFYKNDQAEHE
jgi:[glutamine synthetase] adenylyltransferase / [glutamine synthetase]-adenylyl-L-tyrosine phosphorylase